MPRSLAGGPIVAHAELRNRAEEAHRMGMPAQAVYWTPEMVRELPDDGQRYECIGGELLVTPAPRVPHQRALQTLYDLLAPAVRGNPGLEMLWSPADIELSGDLLQPDLFVLDYGDRPRPRVWSELRPLILAVEALSPSTARADRRVKRVKYQSEGIPEYWIVDLDGRVVERWRPGDDRPEVLDASLDWVPRPGTKPVTIALPEYFSAVLDA
jgi:Uma2 family endonuclease